MPKINKLTVRNVEISLLKVNDEDYICLTDMVKNEDGDDHIRNWMRNRNTVEYLGIWEQLNNPNFKGVEFDTFKKQAGLNSFNLTPKKWIDTTNAIGLISKSGRYGGGTYAHKDIAFNFGMWISPVFQLYLVKEYQRLKNIESNTYGLEWDVKRILSKANYRIHTDAIKDYIVPKAGYAKKKEWLLYANEADMLNIAVFGCTADDWRKSNMDRALRNENLRDMASINELAVLTNLESINSLLIKKGLSKGERLKILIQTAKEQKDTLDKIDYMRSIKKASADTYLQAQNQPKLSSFKEDTEKGLDSNSKDVDV